MKNLIAIIKEVPVDGRTADRSPALVHDGIRTVPSVQATVAASGTRARRNASRKTTSTRIKMLTFFLSWATFLCTAHSAVSEPQTDTVRQAQVEWRKGTKAAARADYETARAAFEHAYELIEDPALLFALGDAEVRTSRFLEGARHLAKFLAIEAGTPAQREASAKALEKAASHLAKVEFRVNTSDAAVHVDGDLVGTTPLPHHIVYLAPGSHAVRVERARHESLQRTVEIGPGESAVIDGELIPLAPESTSVPVKAVPQGSAQPAGPPLASTLAAASPALQVVDPSTRAVDRFSPGRTVAIVSGGVLTAAALGIGVTFLAKRESSFKNRDVALQRIGNGCTSPGSVPQAEACQQLSDAVTAIADDNKVMSFAFPAAGICGVATLAAAIFWPRSTPSLSGVSVAPLAGTGAMIDFRSAF